jgi:hypothetical protein
MALSQVISLGESWESLASEAGPAGRIQRLAEHVPEVAPRSRVRRLRAAMLKALRGAALVGSVTKTAFADEEEDGREQLGAGLGMGSKRRVNDEAVSSTPGEAWGRIAELQEAIYYCRLLGRVCSREMSFPRLGTGAA